MSNEPKPPAPAKPADAGAGAQVGAEAGSGAGTAAGAGAAAEAKRAPAPPAVPPRAAPAAAPAAPPASEAQVPAFDERHLRYSELAPFGKQLDPAHLVELMRDGRAVVRANAVLGLAAVGHPVLDMVTLLRDSDPRVALAAAEAISRLGPAVRAFLPQIAQALDGAQQETTDAVVAAFAELIDLVDPELDAELAAALDVPLALAQRSVLEAAGKRGRRGIAFLIGAAGHERARVRINAIGGLARFGKTDPEPSLAFLTQVEASDSVPDVRSAAKQAMLAIVAREKTVAVDSLPKNIPDFEDRKLSGSELSEYADAIDVDEMIYALQDGRNHVRINGARALGVLRGKAARAARPLGLLLRDGTAAVRLEAAKALGKLGEGALEAAPDLVGALGDAEADVADEAVETLAALGEVAKDALVRGLGTGSQDGGRRAGELIGKLRDAPAILVEAFKSPAVNVQVNAALGLGMLGRERIGAGLATLHGARTGGDARTREAVRRALDMIEPKGQTGPQAVSIDGFEERALAPAELEKLRPELERVGAADFTAYLQDGRDVVRANAATALGVLGPAAAADAARSIGVRLRDDAARVRLAAAQALDRLGDAAVIETADDLVGALRDADEQVAQACAAAIRARKGRMISALVRGLETDDPRHGRRIVELINVFPDASEILCEAFGNPAVNVQVNAALGLGLLGPERVGKGRKALEGARTGGWERTREAVRKALEVLDGPRSAGPQPVEIDGFEARYLGPEAFSEPGKLRADDLIAHLQDGRGVVRANAATALGALGPASGAVSGAVSRLGVLLRDDDPRVRIQVAGALDRIGDDAVRETAAFLVGALRGDAEVAKACAQVLGARKARVLGALVKGLETDDETHARRILELIVALPDACEILCDAFESPAENVQVNAAIGIGMLGAERAGNAGRKKLEGARTGGFARTREAVFKALAMLKG
jgi:HEAT repeat protein